MVGKADGSGVGCKGTDVDAGAVVAVGDATGSAQQPTTNIRKVMQSDAATRLINLFDRNDLT